MLFTYRSLDDAERRVLETITRMRHDLRHHVVQQPRRWSGLLARLTRARALRGSNSVEGINVTAEDAIAAVDNVDPEDADRATWQAVQGYQAAMDYILQRCRDEAFQFSRDVLLAVHFMISQHDFDADPGNFRRGWIGVRDSRTGEIVHNGVDREQLDGLIDELIIYMNEQCNESVTIKAALAHLNFVMLHPFKDGNGRTARCLQTAVLAKEGIISPIFSSIEEYIGRNTQEYYSVLARVGGGDWNPTNDCKPWIRFCLTAHYRQARTLLRRIEVIGAVYDDLVTQVRQVRLHERTALALLEAAMGNKVRNSSYRISADVSNNLASRDLKALVDSGLLIGEGERRGRHYRAGPEVASVALRHRRVKSIPDPFDSPDEPNQKSP